MPLLEVRDLSVCIGDLAIVKGVSFSVEPGEIHVIMGPNGSGKSTLLSCLMGLPRVRPCGGAIFFDGRDVTRSPPHERASLGMVLAHQSPPQIRGVKLAEIAKALVRRCGCSDYTLAARMLNVEGLLGRDLFVGFSGGEKKRAELFLSMLLAPRLAMLDEPDSGVDLESMELIAETINYLARRGTSVILVTHLGNILSKLSRLDYVHIMLEGALIYTGRPDEVLPLVLKLGFKRALSELRARRGEAS